MRCYYCFKPLSLLAGSDGDDRAEGAQKDHLTPVSRGGSDTIDNIVPACFLCNRKKGDMTEPEFRKALSTALNSVCKGVAAVESILPLEQRDEPPLAVLRRESEATSWAWKNRAD